MHLPSFLIHSSASPEMRGWVLNLSQRQTTDVIITVRKSVPNCRIHRTSPCRHKSMQSFTEASSGRTNSRTCACLSPSHSMKVSVLNVLLNLAISQNCNCNKNYLNLMNKTKKQLPRRRRGATSKRPFRKMQMHVPFTRPRPQ
ncbi:hypothetical protein PUN28_010533 [Cardiocondyla obscurior]|uniref:Uncharacterized protein n=1 Tax=Cardiocondyla obscurior TaxID=286306 RepID=A0AAW2FGR5_9HYME